MTNGNEPSTGFAATCESAHYSGLTKREHFAAMVLSGFAADPSSSESTIPSIATYAVRWADALIEALNKTEA